MPMASGQKSDEFVSRERHIESLTFLKIGRPKGFFAGLGVAFTEIFQNRELLFLLIKRDIKVRYKDSVLGIFWSFIRPIVQLAIYYFAVGQVLGAARSIPDFAIYVFIGLSAWSLYNEILSNATQSISSNSGLVKKIYLPRELFPLAVSGTALFNFLVQSVILGLVIVFFARPPLSLDLLLVPLSVLNLLVFSTAIGMALAAFNVFLRDTVHLVEVAMTLLFWFSPIVYSYKFVVQVLNNEWLLGLYLANPVTLSILALQKSIWIGGFDPAHSEGQVWPENLSLLLLASLVISALLLLGTTRMFGRLQGNFAQQL